MKNSKWNQITILVLKYGLVSLKLFDDLFLHLSLADVWTLRTWRSVSGLPAHWILLPLLWEVPTGTGRSSLHSGPKAIGVSYKLAVYKCSFRCWFFTRSSLAGSMLCCPPSLFSTCCLLAVDVNQNFPYHHQEVEDRITKQLDIFLDSPALGISSSRSSFRLCFNLW